MPYITKVKVIWLFLWPQSHILGFPVIITFWVSSDSDNFIFNFLSMYMFMYIQMRVHIYVYDLATRS